MRLLHACTYIYEMKYGLYDTVITTRDNLPLNDKLHTSPGLNDKLHTAPGLNDELHTSPGLNDKLHTSPGLNDKLQTSPICPFSFWVTLPFKGLNSLTVPSLLPVARRSPSGLKATHQTEYPFCCM
jgi:hypothetical protein